MIGVLGSAGQLGSLLTARLSELDAPTKAMIHHEESRERVAQPAVDVVLGDYEDPDSLRTFMEGVDQLFLLTAVAPDTDVTQNRIIDIACERGNIEITKLSPWTAADDSPLILSRLHYTVEKHLAGSGLPYTILQPHHFMQTNAWILSPQVKAHGSISLPVNETATINMVDARDVADVAAGVLTRGAHSGETLVLHGRAGVAHPAMAAALSQRLGREIAYHRVEPAVAKQRLVESGIPDYVADVFLTVMGMTDLGTYEPTPNTVTQTWAGHPPRSFDDFLDAYIGFYQ